MSTVVRSGSAMVGGDGKKGGLLENANPLIYERSGERPVTAGEEDEQVPDIIDAREIFDIRRCLARAGAQGPGRGCEVVSGSGWSCITSRHSQKRVLSGPRRRVPFPSLVTSDSFHQRPGASTDAGRIERCRASPGSGELLPASEGNDLLGRGREAQQGAKGRAFSQVTYSPADLWKGRLSLYGLDDLPEATNY